MDGRSGLYQELTGPAIERRHGFDRYCHIVGVNQAAFLSGCDQASSQTFAQNEKIAGLCSTFCQDLLGVEHAGDGKTVFGLAIGDRVSASDHAPGLFDDIHPTA